MIQNSSIQLISNNHIQCSFSFQVQKYTRIHDHIEFFIKVSYKGKEWGIWKRFKEFTRLDKYLRKIGIIMNFELPTKKWFNRFDNAFLMYRQKGLQKYLDRLLLLIGQKDVQHILEEFLNVESIFLNITKSLCKNQRYLSYIDKLAEITHHFKFQIIPISINNQSSMNTPGTSVVKPDIRVSELSYPRDSIIGMSALRESIRISSSNHASSNGLESMRESIISKRSNSHPHSERIPSAQREFLMNAEIVSQQFQLDISLELKEMNEIVSSNFNSSNDYQKILSLSLKDIETINNLDRIGFNILNESRIYDNCYRRNLDLHFCFKDIFHNISIPSIPKKAHIVPTPRDPSKPLPDLLLRRHRTDAHLTDIAPRKSKFNQKPSNSNTSIT